MSLLTYDTKFNIDEQITQDGMYIFSTLTTNIFCEEDPIFPFISHGQAFSFRFDYYK